MSHYIATDGLRLFLLWVFGPCARLRLHDGPTSKNGKICQADFNWMESRIALTEWADDDYYHLIKLIQTCFPNLIHNYIAFTRTDEGKKVGYGWSIASVAEYWHHHHRHDSHPQKENDVWLGPVRYLDGGAVIVLISEKLLPMENYYRPQVKPGDMVYVHNYVIVEIKTSEPT